MITRDIPFTLPALEDRQIVTCSTSAQGIFTSTSYTVQSCNADPNSTAASGINGRIIDRLNDIMVSRYFVACPVTNLISTRGSTESNRQLTLGVKLQHGDSSAGGDMADYSTQNQPATRTYFTTARTSDMASWDLVYSTGIFYGASNECYYDLRGAKRYIRTVSYVAKNRVTTESSGDEGARVSAAVVFLGGDRVPQLTGNGPTTTATST